MPSVEISFGQSRALNYDLVVELAREFPSYVLSGDGKKLRHTVTVEGVDILSVQFGTLLDFCRELQSTRIRVNGRIVGRTEMWQLHLVKLPAVRRCWNRRGEWCSGACQLLIELLATAAYHMTSEPIKPPPTLRDAEWMVHAGALDLCPAFDPETIPALLFGDVLDDFRKP